MKDVREFVFYLWHDANYYDRPAPMTIADAAYNLREYKREDREIPAMLTPGNLARYWNTLCTNNGFYN